MSPQESDKQCTDLKNAILRLCREADNDDIIINAIMASFVEVCSKGLGLSPVQTLKVCHAYIHVISNKLSRAEMDKFLDTLSKD